MSLVSLAPGADENGFACMIADLLGQNLEANPHKQRDFKKMRGSVAVVAEDADVAITLVFDGRHATIHSGILNKPDVTVRGMAEVIMNMSNLPIAKYVGLPLPRLGNATERAAMDDMLAAMKRGELHTHGLLGHAPLVVRFTRVLSVNG